MRIDTFKNAFCRIDTEDMTQVTVRFCGKVNKIGPISVVRQHNVFGIGLVHCLAEDVMKLSRDEGKNIMLCRIRY
jgi:hypothetical protein